MLVRTSRIQTLSLSILRDRPNLGIQTFSCQDQCWDTAQTRRLGMQNDLAQLPNAPRFSPYRYGPRAHIGTPNALLMPMGLSDLSRRYADKTNHQSLITDY